MTVTLLILALALLLLGHPVAALLLLATMLFLAWTRGKRVEDTPPASYPPEHSTGMRAHAKPTHQRPVDYDVSDTVWKTFLNRANVHGTPGKGLGTAVSDGLDANKVRAGIQGEESLARMLATMDLHNTEVFFSCRNPADPSGRTDVDCVLVSGNTVWLLDAKHYTPAGMDAYLVPTPADPSRREPFVLRVYDRNTNLDVDVRGLWNVAPVRTYHASGNMAWAADVIRRELPFCEVRPLVLLCRTNGGVYGVMEGTCFPGGVPVSTADMFKARFVPSGKGASLMAVRYFQDLLK